MSFYTVVTGNPTNAADINQYANALNGSAASVVQILASANTITPLFSISPSVPASDNDLVAAQLAADTYGRAALYLRSTGYGGLWLGTGAAIAAHIYGQSGGARIDENWTVGGALNVVGASTFAGIVATGTLSLDGGNITSDGAGNLSAKSLKDNNNRVAVQGAHSAGQPIISYGTGAPASLAANEIYIQLS